MSCNVSCGFGGKSLGNDSGVVAHRARVRSRYICKDAATIIDSVRRSDEPMSAVVPLSSRMSHALCTRYCCAYPLVSHHLRHRKRSVSSTYRRFVMGHAADGSYSRESIRIRKGSTASQCCTFGVCIRGVEDRFPRSRYLIILVASRRCMQQELFASTSGACWPRVSGSTTATKRIPVWIKAARRCYVEPTLSKHGHPMLLTVVVAIACLWGGGSPLQQVAETTDFGHGADMGNGSGLHTASSI